MSDSNFQVVRFDPFAKREISAEEEEYRKNKYPSDEKFLSTKSIECSSCGKDVRTSIINDRQLCIHPALEIIICRKCESFYNNGEFSADEDGSDKYCRWCGQGGNLYCCSVCSVAICSRCVKRNLSRKYKDIENDDWRCFVCDPKPIWNYRALCHAAKQYVENHKTSKTSKRPRRVLDTDSESDVEPRVEKKKSKREVSADDCDKKEVKSEDSDSDDHFVQTKKKRKATKTHPSPKPKRTMRNRKVVDSDSDDDQSSSTSHTKTSARNRRSAASAAAAAESNDSSASTFKRKSGPRSKTMRPASPAKKTPTKDRSRSESSSQSSVRKEKSLLGLALLDGNNDFGQFCNVIVKSHAAYEIKYLKNKKKSEVDVKNRFLRLLEDTVESAVGLRDSFLKCLEGVKKKDEPANGASVPDESEMNGDVSVGETADPAVPNGDEKMDVGDVPKKDIHCEETAIADLPDGNETRKTNEFDDDDHEMETSTQNKQKSCENSAKEDVEKSKDEIEELTYRNPDEPVSGLADRGPVEDSEKENVFEDTSESVDHTPQENDSMYSTPMTNSKVAENQESNSEAKNTDDSTEKNENRAQKVGDKCSVKLLRLADPLDDSTAAPNNGEITQEESEADISGVDALKPEADEVETRKTVEGRLTKSSYFESTRIDDDVNQSVMSDEVSEKEKEARRSILESNSSDDEKGKSGLNESSVIAPGKRSQSNKLVLFDSDFDDSEEEESKELTDNSPDSKKEGAIEKNVDERDELKKPERDMTAKKEEDAENSILHSSSDDDMQDGLVDYVSDNDENAKNESDRSNDANYEQHQTSKEEEAAKKSLLCSSSDSDENEKMESNETKKPEENAATDDEVAENCLFDTSFLEDEVVEKDPEDGKKRTTNNNEDRAKNSLLNSDSSLNGDSDEFEKEVNKLTNLSGLERKRQRPKYSSDEENEDEKQECVEAEPRSMEKSPEEFSKKKNALLKSKTTIEEYLTDDNEDSSSDEGTLARFKSQMLEKQKGFATKEDLAKQLLLAYQSSAEDGTDSDDYNFVMNEKPKKRAKNEESENKVVNILDDETEDESNSVDEKEKKLESDESDDSAKEAKKAKAKWKNDPLLRVKLTLTDSSDEERMIKKARKKYDLKEKKEECKDDSSDSEDVFVSRLKKPSKKKKRFVLHSSNSEEEVEEIQTLSSESSSDEDKKKKKKMKRRRRIKNIVSDNSESDKDADLSQSSLKGRKNIREIMNERDLDAQTRKTGKEEEARKKRIAERQALFNKVFEVKDTSGEALKKLVLDYDAVKKKELISVCPELLAKLKPHQAQGVKFMWDACFESLKQVEKGKGGGCILAHCMGLGKTLQVITLVHTLLRYQETKVKTVLIICPLTTVLNWRSEFDKWLEDLDDYNDYNIYELTKFKNNVIRADHLRHWSQNGGVMILGYEMFRSLVNGKNIKEKVKKQIASALLDPGPDLVICDEGHILKNEKSAISKATMQIKSLRRIVLTGTPLQNNLIEYHCMVQFVKPNLLGNKKEFQNQFVNPITNGQYVDSTSKDVKVMKKRAHVLHRMLDGIVQRFDYKVLTPFLPPKHEFVISVGLSDLQAKLYSYYIENKSQVSRDGGSMRLFKDYQIMRLIWTHPLAMKLNADRHQKIQDKEESDSSLKDFIVDESDSDSSASNNSVVTLSSGDETKKKSGRLTRAKKNELGIDLEEARNSPPEVMNQWWNEFVSVEDLEDYKQGPKLMLLFAILRQCELIGDKVLIFSQSIPSLDMIEYFLTKNEDFSQRLPPDSSFVTVADDFIGTWEKNVDYFRLDGQTPNEMRAKYCKSFNSPNNTRTRLFLISTKAGGLGINLTAANRVIIFDASWNPSFDIQSIFRVYRFGQNKPCYIYRFLSQGTMEEKIYERQVTKLSVSCRVVDEQQIDRHFSRKDITELYTFNRKSPIMDEVPKLPSDRLMAELLKQYKDVIINYHEHDSLLENVEDEELTEEERKAAWNDYEEEKNRPLLKPTVTQSAIPNVIMQEVHKTISDQSILQTIKKTHPTATPQQLANMMNAVRQKLVDYYLTSMNRTANSNVDGNVTVGNVAVSNDVRTPASDQQVQDTLRMRQAELMHALQNPSLGVPPAFPRTIVMQNTLQNQNPSVSQANFRPGVVPFRPAPPLPTTSNATAKPRNTMGSPADPLP